MDVVKETKEKAAELRPGGDAKGSRAKKLFLPLVASAASGAAAYAARKLPGLFQERVLPKLNKALEDGGAVSKAKDALEGAVSEVGDRVGSIASGDAPDRSAASRPRSTVSTTQRERQRRERAQRRRQRREALSR